MIDTVKIIQKFEADQNRISKPSKEKNIFHDKLVKYGKDKEIIRFHLIKLIKFLRTKLILNQYQNL